MTETELKIIALLISLNGSALQLFGTLKEGWTKRRSAKEDLSKLGWQYAIIITSPLVLLTVFVTLILLFSSWGLLTSTLDWEDPVGTFFFNNAVKLSVFYGILLPIVHIQILSILLLWLFRYSMNNREVGIVNADWFLKRNDVLAMKLDDANCQRFGHLIYNLMINTDDLERGTIPVLPKEEQTADERANYLLFGFVVMGHIERIWPYDRKTLENAWKYLAWAALGNHFFSADSLLSYKGKEEKFVSELKNLPDKLTGRFLLTPHPLPDDFLIEKDLTETIRIMIDSFSGEGWKIGLAGGRFDKVRLFDNLKKFPEMSNETMQRLFLIMAAQMQVWEDMTSDRFPYPYNGGISLLLLNSRCILVTSTTKEIASDDTNFQSLSKKAQQKVTETVIGLVKRSDNKRKIAEIFTDSQPLDNWQISDVVDQFLYNQVRRNCTKRPAGQGQKMPSCPVCPKDGTVCVCDAAEAPWRIDDSRTLVRS